ncbi:MAG: glyoxalase [Chloroflexi bacterium]|nr:MAG: glyoxalase [Chloroflexota bacterium]
MKTQSIAARTGMGTVDLSVTDGDRALRFYRDYVGLTPLPGDGPEIRMGAPGREIVVLHPDAERPVEPRTSGLYHLAIVVPDRRELARVIARLGRLRWDQYPTDHVMTKANYLWDPDGNGIEIYVESPEDGTMGFGNGTFVAYDKDGRPRSGRDPIDLEEMFSHLTDDDRTKDGLVSPMPAGTKMGHVHLHVADVDDALSFYHDLVGFDVMGHVPGVGFVSAGGYHHHLGLNTWAGQGAKPRSAGSAGLRRFTIELPSRRDLDDVVSRLEHGNVRLNEEDGGLAAVDPSANRILFRAA